MASTQAAHAQTSVAADFFNVDTGVGFEKYIPCSPAAD